MAKPKLVARKTAEELLYNLYAALYFPQKNALMTPNKTEIQQKFLGTLTSFLETASDPDFTDIVSSLDNEGFLIYYDKVGELVKFFAPHLYTDVISFRPVEFSRLDGAIQETKDANLAADIIEGFSAPEISRLPFTSKMKAMNTLMETWFIGQNREREMVKVLNAIKPDERPTFLSAMVAGENAMLKKICDKTDGAENASVFVFFDNLLTQMGYTVKDKNGITITGDRPIEGSFDKGSVKLTTHTTNGYIDKEFLVPAFTPVTFTYQKEKMTVPAFTFTDKDAFKDFVFENKYLETLDWTKLTEKQKEDYYFEFVMHYLPGSFLEQLGSPIQIVIGAIVGIIVGGALAEFEAVLIVANGAMIAGETAVAINGIYNAYLQRKAAKSIQELKASAKTIAVGVAKLTMQVINAILMFKAGSKGNNTNVADTANITKIRSDTLNKLSGYKKERAVEIIETFQGLKFNPKKKLWETEGVTIRQENGRWIYNAGKDDIPEWKIKERHGDSLSSITTGTKTLFQSHHGIQDAWGELRLSKYGYKSKDAPTILLRDSCTGTPHQAITASQVSRQSGIGKRTYLVERRNVIYELRETGVSEEAINEYLLKSDKYFKSIYDKMPEKERLSVFGSFFLQ